MLNTISIPSSVFYSNLYELSGIVEGNSIILTNGTSSPCFVVQSASQPAENDSSYPVVPGQTVLIHNDLVPIWIKGGTGPIVAQPLSSTITPLTGVELPHDIYTNKIESTRRVKTSAEPSLASAIENGFAYTISGSFSVAAGDYLAMNISPAAPSTIHSVVTNSGFAVELYDELATGTADGIFVAKNLNLISIDSTPAQGQLYSPATPVGNLLVAGVTSISPYVICDVTNKCSVVVRNTTGSPLTMKITVTLEEIGARASSFGLTASTQIISTTEMSTFG